MTDKGITISDMIKETRLRRNTIEVRLHRLGIKPLSYEARYPTDALEKVKAVKMGRPKKSITETSSKKPQKS
jgi:hypothetical protein